MRSILNRFWEALNAWGVKSDLKVSCWNYLHSPTSSCPPNFGQVTLLMRIYRQPSERVRREFQHLTEKLKTDFLRPSIRVDQSINQSLMIHHDEVHFKPSSAEQSWNRFIDDQLIVCHQMGRLQSFQLFNEERRPISKRCQRLMFRGWQLRIGSPLSTAQCAADASFRFWFI